MEAVSMTTKSLRNILRKATKRDLGFKMCIGGVFITAHTELDERHLT